tara:strand:+ start:25848 stop:28646 length:2799 start_codon:yes stop_codon:yes gene_type:complete
MIPFLRKVAQELVAEQKNFSKIAIILPSRRAAVFLKKEISKLIEGPVFAPQIRTSEDFLLETLDWEQESNPSLLFKLYQAYLVLDLKEKDSFSDFTKWAQTLLADFNEIDRYLISPQEIFSYLADVKRIESWELSPGESLDSELISDYLNFWEKLPQFYKIYQDILLKDKKVYQGMAYRQMAENLEDYLAQIKSKYQRLYFVGFSALNRSEEQIFLKFYEEGLGNFYWDIDHYYFDDEVHEAGKFLRESKLIRKLRENDEFNGFEDLLLKTSKNITVKSVAGDSLQAMAANATVLEFQKDQLEDIAVVMADENLLSPFLNNIAKEIPTLNITMGLPAKFASMGGIFSLLWDMHMAHEVNSKFDSGGRAAFHYQKWDDLFSHPMMKLLECAKGDFEKLRKEIRKQNQIFISFGELQEWLPIQFKVPVDPLFESYTEKPGELCKVFSKFIERLKPSLESSSEKLGIAYGFYKLFEELAQLFSKYNFVLDSKTAYYFYKDLLSSQTIDLQGEPLSGLQVMGMLETRTLDFKNIIVTSVNEDILPQGRSQNSLIPFDIKFKFGLPTFLDKDGIYAYHFYRLLQRAENICLLYNGQNNGMGGGEASRFINQIEHELSKLNPNISFKRIGINNILKLDDGATISIEKSEDIQERLRELAEKGLSATALIDYINNPIKFYYKRVLGIREKEDLEEVIAYNTQGTILHEILQEYYSEDGLPLQELNPDLAVFKKKRSEIREDVVQKLRKFGLKNIDQGKNLLIRETLTGMLANFLRQEKSILENSSPLEIISLEENLEVEIVLENGQKVKLKGIADRIDRFNSSIRVLDYKSGSVDPKHLKFKNWELLKQPEEKNKSFQLMMYAWLYMEKHVNVDEVEAGIISLRKVKEWPMPLVHDNSLRIDREKLTDFRKILTEILSEIFDYQTPFKEKILYLSDHDQ